MASTKVDYAQTGQEILAAVGGEDNVSSLTHCATRLRFKLKDASQADTRRIKGLDGVVTVMEAGGQYQVVVGNDVPKAYAAIIAASGLGGDAPAEDDAPKGSLLNRFIELISSLFLPMLWTLAGAGLYKAFLALAVTLGFDAESQEYAIMNAASDAIIYFLPFILAVTAAKRFKTNQFTSMALAGFLLYPGIVAFSEGTDPVSFFGIPVFAVSYVSSVIPIIVTVWLQSYLEKWLLKVLPAAIRNFTTPLIVILVLSLLTLLTLGPITVFLSEAISAGIGWFWSLSPILGGALLGGFWQVFVMFGLHWGFVPIMLNDLITQGSSPLSGAIFAPVIAQAAAALAVMIRTRNAKLKQLAGPASLSGFLAGVTEPAVYGVNLPLKKPFIFGCIGGAIGSAIAAAGGSAADSFVLPSLLALPAYLTVGSFTALLTGIGVAVVVTFLLTLFFGMPKKDPEDDAATPVERKLAQGGDSGVPADTNPIGTKVVPAEAQVVPAGTIVPVAVDEENTTDLVSPATGHTVALEDLSDPVFSSGAMGKGLAVVPSAGQAIAPISGVVVTALDSGHAFGIRSETGVEVLIHVGIDTVKLDGAPFTAHVAKGERVVAGQPLVDFDIAAIREAGYDPSVIMIVTNTGNFSAVEPGIGKDLAAGELAVVVEP
ncbi:beta-glucoside-specific PTS transporter subunit IIABC [Rothia halotolerans]|uniref:beta-glucoside-specific PTS transporter subunit IIABC n=1 Tax=Rothia halotolerans TaxID=405770 RepID=UPI00101DFD08|nr:beta-glucoside-specific PTS transporter subunit IIABC [Rothia halotolerans]